MRIKKRFLSLLFLTWILGLSLQAQDANNPFELVPRLDEEAQQVDSEPTDGAQVSTGNPFDLIYDRPRPEEITPYEIDTRVDPIITSAQDRFKFFSVGISLLLLAIIVSLVGGHLNKSIRSFINDNSFNQIFREREGRGAWPYYILYLLFFTNVALFVVYLLLYYEVALPWPNLFLQWVYLFLGCMAVFVAKHLFLLLIGVVFPIQNDIRRYLFLIMVASITLGVLLIPINLLMAYGPEGSGQIVLYSAFGLIGLTYLFRALRGLLLANKYLLFHRFHFLLYICTVEIAPVFIIVRLIMNQL